MDSKLIPIKTKLLALSIFAMCVCNTVSAETTLIANLAEQSDPINKIYSFALGDKASQTESFDIISLPSDSHGKRQAERKPGNNTNKPKSISSIHPELLRLMETDPKRKVQVIINLQENIDIPLFPRRSPGVSRESSAGRNILAQRRQLLDEIKRIRSDNLRALTRKLSGNGKLDPITLKILYQFTLTNAFSAEMRVGDIKILQKNADILFIKPRRKILRALDDGNPDNNLAHARMPYQLNSDYFFNSPNVPQNTFNWIGVIDSGIYPDHTLVEPEYALDIFAWDCVNGEDFCGDDGSAAWDPDDCDDHGTGVSTIIRGNNTLGDAHRGISEFGVDSYKAISDCGTPDVGFADEDVEFALMAAIANDDWVVNLSLGAEISVADGITAELDPTALAADAAFDAGLVVIAAAGNEGPGSGSINCPACAHKALAVGAYDVSNPFDVQSYSSRGPTTDNRIKPDVIAPSCLETATTTGPNDLAEFCGTSASAPAVSAAAMLTRSALEHNVPGIDVNEAGYTYATMLMFARNFGDINQNSGAGPVNMQGCGRFWFGKTQLNTTGETVSIPMSLIPPYGTGGMKAAIWWPESAAQSHNDIDLYLYAPSGGQVASSEETASVFERVSTNSMTLSSGTWEMEIYAYDLPSGPQEVYWSVRAGGCITDIESLSP